MHPVIYIMLHRNLCHSQQLPPQFASLEMLYHTETFMGIERRHNDSDTCD